MTAEPAAEPAPEPAEPAPEAAAPPPADGGDKDAVEQPAAASDRLTDTARAGVAALFSTFLEQAVNSLRGNTSLVSGSSGTFNLGPVLYAGDQHVAADDELPTAGTVGGRALASVRASFVPPAGYPALWRAVEDGAVLILRGRPGGGTSTTALHLLDALCAGRVERMDPTAELTTLTERPFAEHTGYLVDGLSIDQAVRLRPLDLDRLAEAVASRQSRLIIATSVARDAWHGGLDDHIAELGPPAVEEVLARHVRDRLGADAAKADAMLSDPAVADQLGTMVLDGFDGHRVVAFARLLVQVARGALALDAACASAAEQSVREVRAWFERMTDPRHRAFVLALAVLNGSSHRLVAREAADLTNRLDVEPREAFAESLSGLLEACRAERFGGSEETRHGRLPATAVRFRDPTYPAKVLGFVWREYGETQGVLLDWLADLVTDELPEARVKAAAAVGYLATFDFVQVHDRALLPWSGDDERHQEAASAALRMPALDPDYAPVVGRILRSWSAPGQPHPRRLTAARALGASVGRIAPGRSIRLLRVLADSPNTEIELAVSQSITELFVSADHDLAIRLLQVLTKWADGSHRDRADTAVVAFLQLAIDITCQPAGARRPVPALLWLASTSTDYRTLIAGLWRRAMDWPLLMDVALDVLGDWARRADRDGDLSEPLCRLLGAVPASARDVNTLTHYADRWEAPRIAADLRTRLTAKDLPRS